MLDEHFMDQMNELIRLCPRGRQTMLFSATMTDEVCSMLLYHVGGLTLMVVLQVIGPYGRGRLYPISLMYR